MASLHSHKRIAADMLKCGVSRVRIRSAKDAEEALTRADIRDLIAKGTIYKLPKAGSSKAYSRVTYHQKKKGRRKGHGSRKGTAGSRQPTKEEWMRRIRSQRALLVELLEKSQVSPANKRQIYGWIKGGVFRNRKHLLLTLKERGMLAVARRKV